MLNNTQRPSSLQALLRSHSWEYLPKCSLHTGCTSYDSKLCILSTRTEWYLEGKVYLRGKLYTISVQWSSWNKYLTIILLISGCVYLQTHTKLNLSIWQEFTAIKCDNKETRNMEPGTLSLVLEKEKKLPSRYHEHICFVDHDMGKILVFCKSSIFHDL